jgi:hypothetical protein
MRRREFITDYGEHRRTDAQTSGDSAGSSDTAYHRADSLLITGNKTRDAALGEPRIRAGEIIGWRIWRLCNGLLHSMHAVMSTVVIGSVAMWGEVIEHQYGWRSGMHASRSACSLCLNA